MSFEKGQPIIGGQAVIEGVMMKNGERVATAVRTPKGIVVKKDKLQSLTKKSKILGLPFIRGVIILFETLILGIKTLNWSAGQNADEEEISTWQITLTMIFAFVFAIFLFVLVPLYLTKLTTTEGLLFNIIDGILRICIFVIYIFVISLFDDIKRVFQYHGAEHKTVSCYEAKKSLTVQNVKKFSPIHKRCGTTFVLIVLIISIIAFSLVITDSFLIKFLARLLLLPIIAGISYELLHLSAKHDILPLRILILPGLLLQRLTTREPDNKQIEVAIKAMKEVI